MLSNMRRRTFDRNPWVITAISWREAVDAAYAALSEISFEGMFFRRDIAHRAFGREGAK